MKLPETEELSTNLTGPRQSDSFSLFEEELANELRSLGSDVVKILGRKNTPDSFMRQQSELKRYQCLPCLEQFLGAAFGPRTSSQKEIKRKKQHRPDKQKENQLDHGRAAFAKCERIVPIMTFVLVTTAS